MLDTTNRMYTRCLNEVYIKGEVHGPRGMATREVLNLQTQINMENPVVTIPERKLNYRFMLAEAIWILKGRNQLADLTRHCARMADFSDDGLTLSGAYGVPYREQLSYVVDKLSSDRESRQVVMTFWNRNPKPSKDIPCTVALQFLIRGDWLYLNVFMRSWDMWLGMPYDLFSFSMIGQHVASHFRDIRPAVLTVTAGSAHIYATNFTSVPPVITGNHGIKNNIYTPRNYSPDALIYTLESNLNALMI